MGISDRKINFLNEQNYLMWRERGLYLLIIGFMEGELYLPIIGFMEGGLYLEIIGFNLQHFSL